MVKLSRLLNSSVVALVALAASTSLAFGHEGVKAHSGQFAISVGYGQLQAPFAMEDSERFHFLPSWYYYGDNFYIENLSFGYELLEHNQFNVDWYSKVGDDGLYYQFNKGSPFTRFYAPIQVNPNQPDNTGIIDEGQVVPGEQIEVSLQSRDLNILTGVLGQYQWQQVLAKFSALQDVTTGSNGQELQFSLATEQQSGQLHWQVEAGLVWQSKSLVDYYYYQAYEQYQNQVFNSRPGAALNQFVKLCIDYQLTQAYSVSMMYRHTWLDDSISEAPLAENSSLSSGFIGLTYRFF